MLKLLTPNKPFFVCFLCHALSTFDCAFSTRSEAGQSRGQKNQISEIYGRVPSTDRNTAQLIIDIYKKYMTELSTDGRALLSAVGFFLC